MMCGDIRHLELTPAVARRRLGLPKDGYCLSVFDVPTVDEAWRHQFGGGPVSIELEFAEAFFDGIREVLDALPDVRVILKLKRQLGERYRRFPQSMLDLIAPDGRWMREQRVLLVDVNCDPYLPVAAGDASLGMPCTSPVLAALSAGRPAAYYDPLGILAHSPEASLVNLGIRSAPALLARVTAWQKGGDTEPRPEALAPLPVWRNNPGLFASR
jgi:hypothetical protein